MLHWVVVQFGLKSGEAENLSTFLAKSRKNPLGGDFCQIQNSELRGGNAVSGDNACILEACEHLGRKTLFRLNANQRRKHCGFTLRCSLSFSTAQQFYPMTLF